MRTRYAIAILVVLVMTLSVGLPAREKTATSPIFSISREAQPKLKAGQTAAIFLTGNDMIFTTIVEDAIDICLTNVGFAVVNRERLEKTVGEHVDRKRKEKTEGVAINALEIGRAVNAAFIITGAVVLEAQEQKSLVVKIGSLQLVDVTAEKTLVNVLFEPEKGMSVSETARGFADIVKRNMQQQ